MAPARVVVLASGSGTNCSALIAACSRGEISAEVVAVVTNNQRAGVRERAQAAGIDVVVVHHESRDRVIRDAEDSALIDVLSALSPDLVVLAGWMRILGSPVGAAFPMINLHPALPGAFPGVGAIERSWQAHQRGEIDTAGVMVHWVPDDGVDVGPVIATAAVEFVSGETAQDFEARMHATEHELIVAGVAKALTQIGHT